MEKLEKMNMELAQLKNFYKVRQEQRKALNMNPPQETLKYSQRPSKPFSQKNGKKIQKCIYTRVI